MWRCCLHPKVLVGLVILALGSWVVGADSAALPVLVSLVCPLSMGAMMWRMWRTGAVCATGRDEMTDSSDAVPDARLSALREEIATIKARRQLAPDPRQGG